MFRQQEAVKTIFDGSLSQNKKAAFLVLFGR